MGGIWKLIPMTYALMWIGNLALAGIPFFAGYYSKDSILESAFAAHSGVGQYAFWLGIIAALMTAFYSWRLLFLTFHGKPRCDEKVYAHVHESPWVMLAPLVVLAIGALLSGAVFFNDFVGEHAHEFFGKSIFYGPENEILHQAHEVPGWVKILPLIMGVVGIAWAFLFYMKRTDLPAKLASALGGLYAFVFNKWYFDELYDLIFVRAAKVLGFGLWKGGDGAVIDGLGPDGVASVTQVLSRRFAKLQTGYVYHYAFAMLIGVVALVTWYLIGDKL